MIEFIFPYRKDSIGREKNLKKVLDFYTNKFPKEKFLVVEVGDAGTYVGSVIHLYFKNNHYHIINQKQ